MKKITISSLKIIGALFLFVLIFFSSNSLKAKAADAPERQKGKGSTCTWGNTSSLTCGDQSYSLDVEHSLQAGHLVFMVDYGKGDARNYNDAARLYGWLHFVYDSFNDLNITNDPIDGTGGEKIVTVKQDDIPLTLSPDRGTPKNACALNNFNAGCLNAYIQENPPATSLSQTQLDQVKKIYTDLAEKASLLNACDSSNAPLPFIFCPILNGTTNAIGGLIGGSGQVSGQRQGLLISFLELPPISSEPGSVLATIMRNVVNIANTLYILIFLVLIFAGSIPFLNLDSYTIKKTLPKFVMAVILTQFSLQICAIIVDFFNLLGLAIPNVLFAISQGAATQALTGAGATTGAKVASGVGAVVVGGGLVAGAAAAASSIGWILILILAIAALVAGLIAIVYLLIRYFVLFTLIIISPLAFVSWVLPGTEKFFKQWWTNFVKLNAMFVTIMAMLSASIVLSAVLSHLPGASNGALIASVIPIIALMLVPKTLKWTTKGMNALAAGAMGAVAAMGGKAAGAAKGKVTAGAKEGVNQKRLEFGQRMAGSKNPFVSGLGAGMVTGRSSKAARLKAAGGGYEEGKIDEYSQELKNASSGKDFGDVKDDLVKFATGQGSTLFGQAKNKQQQVAAVRELARTGSWGELRQVAESGALSSEEIMQGIGSNVGDAKAALPDIVVGGSANAYGKVDIDASGNKVLKGGVTAETITKMDTSSIEKLVQHYSTSTEPQVKAAIEKQLEVITQSPELQKSLKPEVRDRLRNIDSRF